MVICEQKYNLTSKLIFVFTLISFFQIGSVQAKCDGKGVLSVNGDNNVVISKNGRLITGDQCAFYKDLDRFASPFPNKDCHRVFLPWRPNKVMEGRECKDLVNDKKFKFRKRVIDEFITTGEIPTRIGRDYFFSLLDKSYEDGKENGAIINLTDHGSKVPLKSCRKNIQQCYENPKLIESRVSLGQDQLSATQLRKKIKNIHQNKRKKYCGCGACECSKIPPIIFNFDHCFSGGMLDSLFDPNSGKTLENVCGLSAAGDREYSYVEDKNLATAIDELKKGILKQKSKFKKYDLDGDGGFSLYEVQNYMSEHTRKSTPLLSSQKYLLNYFDRNFRRVKETRIINNVCGGKTNDKIDLNSEIFSFFRVSHELDSKRLGQIFQEKLNEIPDFKNIQTYKDLYSKDQKLQREMDEEVQLEKIREKSLLEWNQFALNLKPNLSSDEENELKIKLKRLISTQLTSVKKFMTKPLNQKFHTAIQKKISEYNKWVDDIKKNELNLNSINKLWKKFSKSLIELSKDRSIERKRRKIHFEGIKARKALNHFKIVGSKNQILKEMDFKTMENLNRLERCERKPIFKY